MAEASVYLVKNRLGYHFVYAQRTKVVQRDVQDE